MTDLVWIGRILRESGEMFLATLWPLALGFTLSGAVQAFTTREQLERLLGNHRPAAVLRAAGYGFASSSCSYAAAAMAHRLYRRGADLTTSLVFLFASTNLVIEIGVVLAVLMGWRFVLAEFVGGTIMILLLLLAAPTVLRGVTTASSVNEHEHEHDMTGSATISRWKDAASYAISDLKMLRVELVVGYLLAGALAVAVPASFFASVFVPGHGIWTVLENAAIGPLVAVVSCVCSIGNVALAAALWHDGIAFGGVVAFLFADLIAFPLLLVYRKLFGQLTWRLIPLFWVVMSTAGAMTEGLFDLLGLSPAHRVGGALPVTGVALWSIALDAFGVGLIVTLWLTHRRGRALGASRLATDPVCGMQVERSSAPATVDLNGEMLYFCSARCADRYRSHAAANR